MATTVVKKTNGKRNKAAGTKYEKDVILALQDAGFPHAARSHTNNKMRDWEKVDICNKDEAENGRLPYNIQCKSTTTPVSYAKLLSEIKASPGIPNVILHRQTARSTGGKFMVKGEYAIMYQKDFIALIKELKQRTL